MRAPHTFAAALLLAACAAACAAHPAGGTSDAPRDGTALLSPSDSTSPQIWVDRERLIVTRFQMPLFPSPSGRSQDVRLENNMPVGGGWLATRVRILDAGRAVQTEDYSDWKADVPLPATFFQAERWSEDAHWARPAGR